jgi:hypothetical protein
MNYHGVQLQPRLLEALIGCLQFFPDHIRAHEMSLIMDLPPSLHHRFTTQEHGADSTLSFRAEEAGLCFHPISVAYQNHHASANAAIVSVNAVKDSDYACQRPLFTEG